MELPIKTEGIIFVHLQLRNEIAYLLLKRTKKDGGFWQPMTGTLNDGESLKECLLRELSEETGIVEYNQILENIDEFEWKNNRNKTITEYVYGIHVDKMNIQLSKEHDKFEWFLFKEAIEILEKENNKRSLTILNNILRGDT